MVRKYGRSRAALRRIRGVTSPEGYQKRKTASGSVPDVSMILLGELKQLKKARRLEYLAEGKNEIPDPIFLSPGDIVWSERSETEQKKIPIGRKDRGHVNMDNFRNRVFWKACDKAKIRRRPVHDTGHRFASLLLSNGESLKYVYE